MGGLKGVVWALALSLVLCLGASSVKAGPIIIAGTDADDHGSVSGGVNQVGWEFMQSAFQNLGPAVTNANKVVVCIGCNAGTAATAFNSAFNLSTLVGLGWTSAILTTNADITNFFNGTGTRNINNTGLIYMPTVGSNVSGGITDTQLGIVNGQGSAINNFVAGGGGLFTQEQVNSSIGYGWLSSLLPGLTVSGDNTPGGVFNSNTLQLTTAGTTAFPGLTNAELSGATPWHAYFGGNLGGLQVLVVGNGNNVPAGAFDDAVVIGGGSGTIIVCGQPGQPPCPIPEPSTSLLLVTGLGFAAIYAAKRRRAEAL